MVSETSWLLDDVLCVEAREDLDEDGVMVLLLALLLIADVFEQ